MKSNMRIYKKINTGVEICNETLCYELTKRHFFRVWKTEHLRAQWLSLTCMKCICTHRDAVTVSYSISCRVNKGAESLFYCVHSHCHSCIHTHRRMRAHTHTHTHTHTRDITGVLLRKTTQQTEWAWQWHKYLSVQRAVSISKDVL